MQQNFFKMNKKKKTHFNKCRRSLKRPKQKSCTDIIDNGVVKANVVVAKRIRRTNAHAFDDCGAVRILELDGELTEPSYEIVKLVLGLEAFGEDNVVVVVGEVVVLDSQLVTKLAL